MKKPKPLEFGSYTAAWIIHGCGKYEIYLDDGGVTAKEAERLAAWLIRASKWLRTMENE